MAIKKRFIECECGEIFTEGKNNQLIGTFAASPWKLKDSRKRQTKTTNGCEILNAIFERSIHCGKCKQELLREKRQYELTPPVTQNDEPVHSYSSREFVVKPAKSDLSVHTSVGVIENDGQLDSLSVFVNQE